MVASSISRPREQITYSPQPKGIQPPAPPVLRRVMKHVAALAERSEIA